MAKDKKILTSLSQVISNNSTCKQMPVEQMIFIPLSLTNPQKVLYLHFVKNIQQCNLGMRMFSCNVKIFKKTLRQNNVPLNFMNFITN